ncbi:uncharacterized protein LOC5509632 isoform X2 [Nematostella vectensis]|uniref:uncharacterized protein LOC5509632 isoform X2 n=1 Tax=Nematostella vectensis TaxID=45351 RepID=UPI002077109C|nr:uncharacterized protein LOC5509632 isoform X2 [Nematostella vectensis]
MSPLLLVLCFVASTAAAACPYGYFKDDVSFECFPCSSVCKQGDHLYPRCKDQCDKVTIAPGSKTTAATLQTTQATTPATTPDNRQYLSRSPDASRRTDTRRIDEDEIVTTAVLASIFGVKRMVVMVATAVWCCRKRRKNNHRSYTESIRSKKENFFCYLHASLGGRMLFWLTRS